MKVAREKRFSAPHRGSAAHIERRRLELFSSLRHAITYELILLVFGVGLVAGVVADVAAHDPAAETLLSLACRKLTKTRLFSLNFSTCVCPEPVLAKGSRFQR